MTWGERIEFTAFVTVDARDDVRALDPNVQEVRLARVLLSTVAAAAVEFADVRSLPVVRFSVIYTPCRARTSMVLTKKISTATVPLSLR